MLHLYFEFWLIIIIQPHLNITYGTFNHVSRAQITHMQIQYKHTYWWIPNFIFNFLWNYYFSEVFLKSGLFFFFPQLERRSSSGKAEVSSPLTGRLTSGQARAWTAWRWASAPRWRTGFWCASTALRVWETTSCSTSWVLYAECLNQHLFQFIVLILSSGLLGSCLLGYLVCLTSNHSELH